MADLQFPPLNNPKQFEHMVCDMFNELFQTITFKCYGKNGHKQKGVDVFSTSKQLIIQCKLKDLTRNATIIKKELFKDIDDTIDQLIKIPPTLAFDEVFILTTASEHPDFDDYCQAIKLEKACPFNVTFWGWETIQRKLGLCPETLKLYYPNYTVPHDDKADQVKKRLSMKKRLEHDFSDWLNYPSESRKFNSKMIIHSIDDEHYPEHVKNDHDEYQWFGAEIHKLKKNGLGFINEIKEIYVTSGDWWTVNKPEDITNFVLTKVAAVKVVAFDDIVDYDLRGDEYHSSPHFYLRFNHNGQPFCETYYQKIDSDKLSHFYFDDSTNIDLLNA